MIKVVLWFLAAIVLLPTAVQAQTVSVILSGDTTRVIQQAPTDQGQVYSVTPTVIDISDSRWVAFLSLTGIQSKVNALLAAGVTMTFSNTTSANDSYSATAAALQTMLNLFTGKFGIKGHSTVDVKGNTGIHTMSSQAFNDLYAALDSYSDAVLAAQSTAVTNGTVPVWPVATASSVH